ncbi:hypothetical protein BRM13312_00126 [Salmonella phage BRM 13312]|nr:hypothetical protein BRM13312_00126 [Salmonella phage BRM 13312]
MIYAYKIEMVCNGKVYIGVTNHPQRRYDQHFSNAFHHGVQSELYDAMRKYGTSGFTFVVIAQTDEVHKWELEKQLIAQYNSYEMGYNMNKGGNDGSHMLGKTAAKLTSTGEHIGLVSLIDPRWELCEIEPVLSNVDHGFDFSSMKIKRLTTN